MSNASAEKSQGRVPRVLLNNAELGLTAEDVKENDSDGAPNSPSET